MHNFMNLSTTTKVVLSVILLAALGFGGYLIYTNKSDNTPATENTTENPLEGVDLSAITGTTTIGGYTIVPEPVEGYPEHPAIERSVPASSPALSAEGRVQAIANLNVTVANLKKEPYVYESWIDLGTLRKLLGDTTGAREAWEYAGKLNIQQPLAFFNLANLYVQLKDNVKAEANFQKAISLSPSNPTLYRSLFEFYRDVYKQGGTAAEDALKAGISKVPGAVDLKVLLARYYKEEGRTAEARIQYEAAISTATAQGQRELVSALQAELNAMGN